MSGAYAMMLLLAVALDARSWSAKATNDEIFGTLFLVAAFSSIGIVAEIVVRHLWSMVPA